MSVLKGLIKTLKNPYATIAKDGLICGDISGYIDTGIYTLNALTSGKLLGGGFPKGKVVALAGEKGTGKTFILINSLAKHLNKNLKAEVILFESEGALTKKMLEERGVDLDRVAVFPVSTVEEFRHQSLLALEYLDKKWEKDGEYPDVVVALDSLGMLGTEFEQETSRTNDNKADMGKRAQLIKSVFRNITLKLSLLQIPMIITNHTYKGMGKYDPTKMGGGQGLEFAASIIIFLSKRAVREEAKTGKSKIKQLMGNDITFIVHKGRLTIEGSRATVGLNFKGGIDRNSGILELLVEAGIVKQAGAWFSYNEERIGQGKKNAYKTLDNFLNNDLLNELEPFIQEKYCYGSANTEEATQEVTEEI